MKNPFLIRPTAALAFGIMLLSSACTPTSSDPFERMVKQTGLNTDVVDISTHPGTCDNIFSCSTDATINRWCTTPLYEGPPTDLVIMREFISSTDGEYDQISSYPIKVLRKSFPDVDIDTGGSALIFGKNVRSISHEIVKSMGLPRYAYSGNLSSCHSTMTLVYGDSSLQQPSKDNISSGDTEFKSCGRFISFLIKPSTNGTSINSSHYRVKCK